MLKNKVEFSLKFEIGSEAFGELVRQKIGSEAKYWQSKLESIQSQIWQAERKFTRLQARRQGKVLLECEYNKSLGCLGVYQCANCQTNYAVASSQPVERV